MASAACAPPNGILCRQTLLMQAHDHSPLPSTHESLSTHDRDNGAGMVT